MRDRTTIPFRPICARCRDARRRARRHGDRSHGSPGTTRYAEKLATPDTSVADLIGDVDPIRVAEGRYLADELTIHYGMIPRTHRGIVAINELPDLPERIQVSLFNILEERDVQIRGYRIRLPLDLLLVVTANPDDYTHRGRIVSPLKDRFGTQVRTHYPETPARRDPDHGPGGAGRRRVRFRCACPLFMKEIVASLTQELRRSPHVNHRSGISVRYSIGNVETLAAAAVRRAARDGRARGGAPRGDRSAGGALTSSQGRVEFDTIEEGREDDILARALRQAELDVFRHRLSGYDFSVAPRAVRGRLRRRDDRPHARPPSCSRGSATCRAFRSCSSVWASRRRAPASRRARSSSRSRGCTCPAGSTRTRRRRVARYEVRNRSNS